MPTQADLNALSAVVIPAGICWGVASRHHRFPRFVGRSWRFTSILRAMPMLSCVGVSAQFKLRASLALGRIFTCQGRPAHGRLGTAVATDSPVFVLGDMVRKAENSHTPKASARKIDWSHMMIISYETGAVYG